MKWRCWLVRRHLTAWSDSELTGHCSSRIETHLQHCPRCMAEARAVRWLVDLQRSAAGRVSADLELGKMWNSLVARLDEAEESEYVFGWTRLRPAVVAVALLVVCLAGFIGLAGDSEKVLIPLGIKPPPAAVSRAPVLFRDYPMIEKLDLLQHFDMVETIPLEEDGTSAHS